MFKKRIRMIVLLTSAFIGSVMSFSTVNVATEVGNITFNILKIMLYFLYWSVKI